MESEKTVRPVFLREEKFISNKELAFKTILIPVLLPCWILFRIIDKIVEEIKAK